MSIKPARSSQTPASSETDSPMQANNPAALVEPKATHDRICKRAHELFLARNHGPGDAASDWYRAEKELCEACDHAPPEPTDPLVVETRTRSTPPAGARK